MKEYYVMKIIVSPTKRMVEDFDYYLPKQFPIFQNKAQQLLEVLSKQTPEELAVLFKCNSSIAKLNYERYQTMDLSKSHVSALFAYEGLAFKHMAPKVFSESELTYVEEHLRIVSGFYGLLRCDDAVSLYRLEMQTKLPIGEEVDLYVFWKDAIARELFKDEDCIINLASEEYSRCVLPYKEDKRVITCIFAKLVKGKLRTFATEAKCLRGEMVRYMAERQIENVELIKEFQGRNYKFREDLSNDEEWYFVKEEQ